MFNEVGILHFLLGFVLGHVCGSVPSGLWLVQAFHGIDIRNYGSKNIGTTNVFRTVGPKTAVLVLIADAFKGILAVGIMSYFSTIRCWMWLRLWVRFWDTIIRFFWALRVARALRPHWAC